MGLGWYVAHSNEKSLPLAMRQVWQKSPSESDSLFGNPFFIFSRDKTFEFDI